MLTNGYIAFYNGKRIELYSDTLYHAQQEAAKLLKVKPKYEYRIAVHLCEKDGQPVEYVAS
jgi:hypothetical protein